MWILRLGGVRQNKNLTFDTGVHGYAEFVKLLGQRVDFTSIMKGFNLNPNPPRIWHMFKTLLHYFNQTRGRKLATFLRAIRDYKTSCS
mgnify:CR=1 FL=1